MRLRAWRLVPLLLAALGAAACTRNPYVIGTICPAAGSPIGDAGAADPRCGATTLTPDGGTLVVDLDTSGANGLGTLMLPAASVTPSLWLRGEHATATAWPSESGGRLVASTAAPTPGLGAPFTDGTGAVGLPAAGPGYVGEDTTLGSVGADDFVLEVVLRALPGAALITKQSGGAGWALRTTAAGALELDLGDGDAAHAAAISTPTDKPLISGAWYHCLFWVSRAVGGRVDCDGSAGTLGALPPLGSLDVPLALGAGGGAPIRVAHVALFRVAPGGLGAETGWLAASARRFATLTGVYPKIALGAALPAPGLRGSAAYLDLQDAPGASRRLFLVGPDWPRVSCRVDALGVRACGYLSEPKRARGVPADATAWQPTALTASASATLFPDGEPRFVALAPSTAATAHGLSMASTAGGQNQVFSFFVHRLTAARVGASGGAAGMAVFDLAAGRVASIPPDATPTIEAWGADVFRCTYAIAANAGPKTYAVRLLDDAGNETFAGTGAPAIEVGGLQVDDNLAIAGSFLAADPQEPDHLTFVADDGNLPTGTSGAISLNLLLPGGVSANDQAILNLNRGGSFQTQVQLYVIGGGTPDRGNVKFWRLENSATHWAFNGALPVVDGVIHQLTATWDASSAHLVIDTTGTDMAAQVANDQPLALDRIDVGFSQASSGALGGLVSALRIGAM